MAGVVKEQPKEAGVTTWTPTASLRYKRYKFEHTLEQKWVETNTGAEEWRKIETV